MIRGLLDRVEDDPDLSKSDIYNLRTQKSDQFTNIVGMTSTTWSQSKTRLKRTRKHKKANFLDLIGQTKAFLCEKNSID